MTHKRIALLFLGGSLLLLTPFLISLSQGVEKSIFSAMATLTDVKETLDEKLILLSDLYLSLDAAAPEARVEKARDAQKHYLYAKDVYGLSTSFIQVSSKRYPRYGTFWERYASRLDATWREISSVRDKIAGQAPEFAAAMATEQVAPVGELPRGRATAAAEGGPAVAVSPEVEAARDETARRAAVEAVAVQIRDARPATAPAVAASPAAASVPAPVAVVKAPAAPAPVAPAPVAAAPAAVAASPVPAASVSRRSVDKKDVLERYREGYQFFAMGGPENLEKAAVAFREILDVQPAFHLARYWLAKTYLLQDKVDRARDESSRLLAAQPNLQIARDLEREVATVSEVASAPARPAPRPAPVVAAPPAAPVAPAPPASAASAGDERLAAARAAAEALLKARAAAPKAAAAPQAPAAAPAPVVAAAPVRVAPAPLAAAVPEGSRVALAPSTGRRPIACMIENSRLARPQSGLSQADYVFEMPVEGGITRFMAVFMDPSKDVKAIGPVRSARHYFVQHVPSLDALYAHCGSSTEGYVEIKKADVDDIDEIKFGHGFFRESSRRAPHNLYTSLGGLRTAFERRGFPLEARRTPVTPPLLSAADRSADPDYLDLELRYHGKYVVRYTFDPLKGTYFRFINDEPHVEALDGHQLTADNVLVLMAGTKIIDSYGRLDVDLTSGGEGWLHRGGRVFEGRWQRSGRYGALSFTDRTGRVLPLNPGQTWVQYLPSNGEALVARRPLPEALARQLMASTGAAPRATLYAMGSERVESPFGEAPAVAPAAPVAPVAPAAPAAPSLPVASPRRVQAAPAPAAPAPQAAPTQVSVLPRSNVLRLTGDDVPPELAPIGPRDAAPAAAPAPMTMAKGLPMPGEVDVVDFELDAF